ncbi:polysialyltransferase family glycosyltransferase [Sanguibacter sp. HDW7]|uniref:polysialyltransferase family glycosyltransferase n=1 Tax=Sanguibacter sp. HDW7 TaxID=2714931 RepID=UPI00140C4434|nr:polysialyltransferase family glycosyltransferase [Sanguibacter sp. HDW7]QIK82958.1 hypothetical protein G7063_04455 [Sanguibacter sp. HDW7]
MTQLLLVTSPRQMLLIAAAIDHGALPPAPHGRVVVLADTVPVPETGPELATSVALAALTRRGARVVSWTATIAPLRPESFVPRRDEQPVWERFLRERWLLTDGRVDLVLADPAHGPGRALARVFPHARLVLLADRLDAWAPARRRLRDGLPERIDSLVAPELLPGLRPHSLDEHGTRTVVVPVRRLVDVVAEVVRLDAPGRPSAHHDAALVLVDAPADLGLHDGDSAGAPTGHDPAALADRLAGLVADEVRGAGLGRAVLVVHPRSTPDQVRRTACTLRAAGVEVTFLDDDVPAEVVVVRDAPRLVVGTASTALVTALALGAHDVRAVGTADVLDALTPYHHPARTGLTVTDRLLSPGADPSASEVVLLLEAVMYVMHPDRVPHLRPATIALLRAEQGTDAEGRPAWRRWIRKRRLERLGLLGATGTGADLEHAADLELVSEHEHAAVPGASSGGRTAAGLGRPGPTRPEHVVASPRITDDPPRRPYRLQLALQRLRARGPDRSGA